MPRMNPGPKQIKRKTETMRRYVIVKSHRELRETWERNGRYGMTLGQYVDMVRDLGVVIYNDEYRR